VNIMSGAAQWLLRIKHFQLLISQA
jgi:hypothetical protein